jgi:hypothetical protein
MLLAVLQYFSQTEAKKVLRLAANWGVRGLVVGGIGGGSTEKAYCDAAVAIRIGAVKDAADLLGKVDSIVPTDDEFRSAFATIRVTKTSLARYYLLALEAKTLKRKEPELVPNSNEEQVNLEHVLPKKATPLEWPQFPGELHAQWVDRLGNQALLAKTPNNKIGNRPFPVKRPVLARSELELTKQIGSQVDWTPDAIAKRQLDLATIAVSVWKWQL